MKSEAPPTLDQAVLPAQPSSPLPRFWIKVLVVSLLAFVLLAVGTAWTRAPYGDEAFNASPAVTLARDGYLGLTFFDQWGTGHHMYALPPAYMVTQAAWVKLVGISAFKFRLSNIGWAFLLMGSMFLIVGKFSGDRIAAALAAAWLGLDYTFLMNVNGRPEMMSAACAFAAIAAYVCLREQNMARAVLLSQTCLAISSLAHPMGAIAGGLSILVLAMLWDLRRLQWSYLAWALLPYLVLFSAWGVYIMQAPELFSLQAKNVSLGADRFAGLHAPLQAIVREIRDRYMNYYGMRAGASLAILLKAVLPLGYLAGVILCLALPALRRSPGIRKMLVILAVYFSALTWVEGTKQLHYLLHIVPVFVALIALALRQLWIQGAVPRWVIGTVCVGLLGLQILPVLYRIRLDAYHKDYLPAARVVQRYGGPGKLVDGSSEMAFALGFDDHLLTDYTLGYDTGRDPDVLITESTVDALIDVRKTENPPAYLHAQEWLRQAALVYNQGTYRVWVKRALADDK